MRMAVLVRMPAAGSSTSPSAETTRGSPGRRLLADSPPPGRTAAEQTSKPALQYRPRHQPVLVGYGYQHGRSLPAVVAFQHPV